VNGQQPAQYVFVSTEDRTDLYLSRHNTRCFTGISW